MSHINRHTEMQNILLNVQEIFDDNAMFPIMYSAVFDIVKILADNINYRANEALLSNKPKEDVWSDFFTDMRYKVDETKVEREIVIQLGKHPVLSNMWYKRKQISKLRMFSEEEKIWKEDKINHTYYLFLPMGLTVVAHGFHSINAGIVKAIGSLCFSPNFTNGKIYDFSPLYETIYFDGTDYREKATGKIMQGCDKGKSIFELGCIFEIGRIIHREAQKGHTINFPYRLHEEELYDSY